MKTKSKPRTPPPASKKSRPRFGYDHRWWGEVVETEKERVSYWEATRRPLPCLAFVAFPLFLYEFGIIYLGGASSEAYRTGADAWMRQVLGTIGLRDHWFLPLILLVSLLIWHAVDQRAWRFSPAALVGMVVESLVLAVALIGLSRVVDLGFTQMDAISAARRPLAVESPPSAHPLIPLIGFLGAGVYEEALFRLALVPLLFGFARLLQVPGVLASTFAMTVSALLFSLAHHAGTPGEAFTWFAFIFRWFAGVYFAWVFAARGFAIAVGTHCAYDVIVGWLGWHF
ncbi:CPBP family intramembrane glutamic endopeptidase [Singulisphaera sp. PoT]|uniref:CPBP family intramembrane glutamic endopeptidase n=1 Tax=Singulisphaera sp. PoT TaxID=3411797 RepID=UPI003BF4D927